MRSSAGSRKPGERRIHSAAWLSNDGDDWVHFPAAIRYAADNGLVLVIPDAGNSFYNDMAWGQAWHTWLTEEMPALLRQMVRLPEEREKNFIAGMSMGGYGALRIGLAHPERYAGVASFSGCVDLPMMMEKWASRRHVPSLARCLARPSDSAAGKYCSACRAGSRTYAGDAAGHFVYCRATGSGTLSHSGAKTGNFEMP